MKMIVTLRLRHSVAALALFAPLLTSPASAQAQTEVQPPAEEDTSRGGLAEIVVTATKHGELNLQNVASSIQVLGAESLQQQQIQGFDDYARMVPSLSAINQGPGQTQIVMRGVTTGRINHSQPQSKSTTGLYIDEIPVSAGAFNPDLALFDVERIEVLRGPQGTLYGAGAMSGALRILTNQPKVGRTEGLAEATVSSTKSGGINYGVRGMVNLPVGDVTALRVSGYYDYDDGYIDNVYSGENDYNSGKTYGGRASLKIEPSSSFDLTLNAIHQKVDYRGRPDEFINGTPIFQAPGENTTITEGYQVVKFLNDPYKDKFWIFNAVVNADLGFANLTSSSSYFTRQNLNALDDTYRNRNNQGRATQLANGEPLLIPFFNSNNTHQWSNETRLASPTGGTVEWVAGVYYNWQRERFVQSAPEEGLDDILTLYGLPTSTGFGAEPNNVFQGNQVITQRQYAAFGELTVNFSPTLSGLVGLRYFNFDQNFVARYAGIANDGVSTIDQSIKEDGVNPKFQLNFKPKEEILIYAQAAKGFRLGGVNEPVPLLGILGTNCSTSLAERGLTGLPPTFGSDSLWNYELGFKGQTSDRRATLNVAAYQIDWDNIQTSVFLPCSFTTVVNAGKARNRGIEGELRFAATPNLTLAVSGSYTDAKLVRAGLAFDAQAGEQLPNVPKVLLNGSFDFNYPMNDNASVYVRGNIQHQSASYSDFRSLASAVKVPASTSGDLFAGFRKDPVEVSIFVKNITNERIVTAVDTDRQVPVTYSVAAPRTIGVTGRVRF